MNSNVKNVPQRSDSQLLTAISEILRSRGLKGMTMDGVASALGMSKRTLYEIFGSKKEMIIRTLDFFHNELRREFEILFHQAPNMMVAFLDIFTHQRKMMENVDVRFFQDLNEHYPEMQSHYHADQKEIDSWLEEIYTRGVNEDVFRPGMDFHLCCVLFKVQMESLKQKEKYFPPELTLMKAFDAITISFLRTIASPKGMAILDNTIENRNNITTS
ncbi:MAG: TetR/AcrR family transcriptional regulator [Prevotella sp.]|nr:TetR/AcrR family transcriptional regulator [Bacteroides sp.]MCM1367024.1 TetR/AcrR family transcriptional regulator [Prevotella sp.]MCM1437516.1 TetR/AcrR family transcriptional regulator [Prevotella sp.]